ncbi:MAG: DegT/DnrJ/EryC1/StrS family aminotransferase [Acidimicrobiales bacterium]|nr:DegT/DnrJ/EryC1/StrS family aminotransferase [Acidimicrobiales bacterium]
MSAPIPFVDLGAMHAEIREQLDAAWTAAVDTNGFIGGNSVATFEQAWAEACGRRHCIGVANGTDALELVLRAADIGPGHEVIVPTNTFVATAEAVVAVGATPRFVDVDEDSLLVTADHVEAAISPATRAIMAVHLYGQMVDLGPILALAERHGIAVIEDAAQAHLAERDGRVAGSSGLAAGFSFYPGKNLGAFGDGGAVVTDDTDLAATIRSLADHGRAGASKYLHDLVGRNSRLDALQAAILSCKLERLAEWNDRRRQAAAWYAEALAGLPVTPISRNAGVDVFHLYVVRTTSRDALLDHLAAAGVGAGVHYPVPCHQQPAFAGNGLSASLPIAEAAAGEILSLPMHPAMTEERVARVAEAVADFFGSRHGG